MAGAQRRKGTKGKNKALHRAIKNKHYVKDHDQIYDDLQHSSKFNTL